MILLQSGSILISRFNYHISWLHLFLACFMFYDPCVVNVSCIIALLVHGIWTVNIYLMRGSVSLMSLYWQIGKCLMISDYDGTDTCNTVVMRYKQTATSIRGNRHSSVILVPIIFYQFQKQYINPVLHQTLSSTSMRISCFISGLIAKLSILKKSLSRLLNFFSKLSWLNWSK